MASSLVQEFHVMVAALLILVLLPAWTLRQLAGHGWKIGYWIPAATSFWLVAAFLLSILHSFRFTTLILVAVLLVVLSPRLLTRGGDNRAATAGWWHLLGHPRTVWHNVAHSIRTSIGTIRGILIRRYGVLACLLMLVGVIVALVTNSLPILRQVAPGTPLGYVNLLQIADINTNHGFLQNGVPTIGLPALGSTLSTMFFIQPLDALRFLYPLTAIITVLAVGALAHEVTDNPKLTALSVFLVGATGVSRFGFAVNWASPLALHWGLIGALFSLTHLTAYAKQSRGPHPIFFGLSLFMTILFSPVMALIPLLAGLMVVVRYFLLRPKDPSGARQLLGPLFIPLLLGLLPLAYAHIVLRRPLDLLSTFIPLSQRLTPLYQHPFAPHNAIIMVILAVACAGARVSRSRTVKLLAAWELALVLSLEVMMISIPLEVTAWVIFSSGIIGLLALLIMVEWALGSLLRDTQYPRGLAMLVALCAGMGLFIPLRPYLLNRYEPLLSARTVLAVSQHFEPYQWTIVSPVQQYSEVLGWGWHEELSSFVKSYSLNQASNPRFQLAHDGKLSIDTPNVFIFAEPRLFPSQTPVSPHFVTAPIANGTAAYEGASLAALESRTYYWILAYHHSHPRTSSFYVKTPDLMVLWIRQ